MLIHFLHAIAHAFTAVGGTVLRIVLAPLGAFQN